MPKFNASQREAIDARNRNILVSAAAGSGKTTVMVEKIRETLIRDPELLEQAAREGSNRRPGR